MRRLLILANLFLVSSLYAQGIPFHMGAQMHFLDANGDTLITANGTTNIVELRRLAKFDTVRLAANEFVQIDGGADGKILLGIDGADDAYIHIKNDLDVAKIKLVPDGDSKIIGNLIIGEDAIPQQVLDVRGYIKRWDTKDWDAIAWHPLSDSGAVLDTLDNIIEVLGFYHNTDSVYVTNTLRIPPYVSNIDSMQIVVEAPNTSGDSVAYKLEIRAVALGEAANGSFTTVDIDTVDLGTTSRALKAITLTGFSGISANDLVDFKLSRVKGIANDVQAVVNMRETRIFWR